MAAFGARQVMAALLDRLRGGTDPERAGAARAIYHAWAFAPRGTNIFTPEAQAEYDAVRVLRDRWDEAALREFVANPDLDVRRCILPLLNLKAERWPAELRELVTEATRISHAHPDEYIRHRGEIQAGRTVRED
ncbi:hypothetical protein [Actinomadura sp. 21ATH]|uniref:hypothetical protein n=1 Tax=Actinomadura sp. 21ATH TaxID=1735444 RepID=UPI0035C01290